MPLPLRSRRRELALHFAAVLSASGAIAACRDTGPSRDQGSTAGEDAPRAAARLVAEATPGAAELAVPEPFPWEPLDAVRGELSGALTLPDWSAIAGRVPAGVAVMRYPSGAEIQELTADQFIGWLRARWAPGVGVGEPHFVAHFPSLEVPTTGWRPVAPSGSTVYFVYHVNPDTRQWFLDVLQYE